MAPYLSSMDIAARLLSRFGIATTIAVADADIASDELDAQGPFIGEKLVTAQARQFPRNQNPDGSINASATVPWQILDWVALRAYQLSVDEGPAVRSEGAGGVSVSYYNPKISQTEKRMEPLLPPYLANIGGFWTIGVASTFEKTA